MEKVWMMPAWGQGEPMEVEATPDVLTPLMVAGYSQCEPPANTQEVTTHVDDYAAGSTDLLRLREAD